MKYLKNKRRLRAKRIFKLLSPIFILPKQRIKSRKMTKGKMTRIMKVVLMVIKIKLILNNNRMIRFKTIKMEKQLLRLSLQMSNLLN
jgi:hypothetical protein